MNEQRRTLLAAASALSLCVLQVHAQTGTGKRRIAYLSYASPGTFQAGWAHFKSELRDLGWNEGSNLTIDLRYALGDPALYVPLTNELLALQPDIFVGTVDYSVIPAAAATKTVPIVFISGSDPVGRGLVKSLASPGGNVTGFAIQDGDLTPKRLSLLKEAIPGLKKVGVFIGSKDRFGLERLEDARRNLDLEFVAGTVDGPDDIGPAFDKFARAGVQGVLDWAGNATIVTARERVAALAIRHHMAMSGLPGMADSGVLLCYAYDIDALLSRAARLVDRILRGAKPVDIPVEQVNVFELVVNLRTARALGIELPRSLMLQATRVIE